MHGSWLQFIRGLSSILSSSHPRGLCPGFPFSSRPSSRPKRNEFSCSNLFSLSCDPSRLRWTPRKRFYSQSNDPIVHSLLKTTALRLSPSLKFFEDITESEPYIASKLLLARALGVAGGDLLSKHRNASVSPAALSEFENYIKRYENAEPLQYIVGSALFYNHDFLVSPATLIPRDDSSVLVQEAIRHIKQSPSQSVRVLDLGTGSGCLLLSILAAVPPAFGVGVDLSPEALEIAKLNAKRLNVDNRVSLIHSRWLESIPRSNLFDVIVSNPPYISVGEYQSLSEDVKKEPTMALVAGEDGLDCYRDLADAALHSMLTPGGVLILEVGYTQARAVSNIFEATKRFKCVKVSRDLGQVDRCLTFAQR